MGHSKLRTFKAAPVSGSAGNPQAKTAKAVRRTHLSGAVLGGALICGAAVSGGVESAAAADLMTKAPQQYVKRCLAEGEGFFYIPGTDTCIKLGGYVWMEGYYNTFSNYPQAYDDTYTVATGALILDTRTATEYGTLRSYIEARMRWRTADPWSDGPKGSEIELWNAYIQFGGFTAGHAQSFFDFYANADVLGTDPGTIGDDTRTNLLAYTWEFGSGFSATLSLEDGADRVNGVSPFDPEWPDAQEAYESGQRWPAFVGNVKVEQAWGSAQISGAVHEVRALNLISNFDVVDTWGYALQAGIKFKLDALAEGDTLYLQSAYVDGAVSYLGLQDPSGYYPAPDGFVTPYGVSTVTGWNLTASFLHNWTEKWSTAVFGGYAAYDFNNLWVETAYGASGGTNLNVGGYVAFTPVKDLKIALQYDFTRNSATDYVVTDYSPPLETTNANRVLLFVSRDF